MHPRPTTFENIVTLREIAWFFKQYLPFPQCFKLFSVIVPTFIETVHAFSLKDFKVVCCRFVVCGKGLNELTHL